MRGMFRRGARSDERTARSALPHDRDERESVLPSKEDGRWNNILDLGYWRQDQGRGTRRVERRYRKRRLDDPDTAKIS
jgi:hypothetical protein